MRLKLLLAGDGGQGIQTIADIICQAAFDAGRYVSFIPNYGLEQRGGVSLAFIQVSNKEIGYPKFTKPDILLVMSEQARERTKQYQSIVIPTEAKGRAEESLDRLVKEIPRLRSAPLGMTTIDIEYYKEKLTQEKIQTSSQNVFFLGVLVNILDEQKILDIKNIEKILEGKLGKKPGWEQNKKAFENGLLNFDF